RRLFAAFRAKDRRAWRLDSHRAMSASIVSVGRAILSVRHQRVILSEDLARIYGVETRSLNKDVKRNRNRFPSDFAFRLTNRELRSLRRSRSQFVILKRGTNVKYLRWPSRSTVP